MLLDAGLDPAATNDGGKRRRLHRFSLPFCGVRFCDTRVGETPLSIVSAQLEADGTQPHWRTRDESLAMLELLTRQRSGAPSALPPTSAPSGGGGGGAPVEAAADVSGAPTAANAQPPVLSAKARGKQRATS